MCTTCGHYPCISGCPNYEREKVDVCEACGDDIVVGHECISFDGALYHQDCFEDNVLDILKDDGYISYEIAEASGEY